MMKIGAEMDHAVKHTLGIASIQTNRRWLQEEHGGRKLGPSIFRAAHPLVNTTQAARNTAKNVSIACLFILLPIILSFYLFFGV